MRIQIYDVRSRFQLRVYPNTNSMLWSMHSTAAITKADHWILRLSQCARSVDVDSSKNWRAIT